MLNFFVLIKHRASEVVFKLTSNRVVVSKRGSGQVLLAIVENIRDSAPTFPLPGNRRNSEWVIFLLVLLVRLLILTLVVQVLSHTHIAYVMVKILHA